jgi:Tfp pilus assembly protein PilF
MRQEYLFLFCLVILTLAVYWPVQHFDFINLDDDLYITDNPAMKEGLTWDNLHWAFSSDPVRVICNWHPVTWISLFLDCSLFGLNPYGYHIVNVLIHILNVLMLFAISYRMTKEIWLSAFTALLFAIHPVHVESVVWIAERKDVLCAFFSILTMGAYILYTERKTVGMYLLMTLFFVFGLMSKAMAVTLPLVLLLLDYWPLNRLPASTKETQHKRQIIWRLLLEKIPLLVLSGLFSMIAFDSQREAGAVMFSIPFGIRTGNALQSYVIYLKKMVWPVNLSVFYPYPAVLLWFRVVGCALVLAGISFFVAAYRKKFPFLVTGWLWYLITLLPVIGIVQIGHQAYADRYMYLPSVGIILMVVWGSAMLPRLMQVRTIVLAIFVAVVLSLLMGAARQQVDFWRNSRTIFEHALEVTQNNYLAHTNLAVALFSAGDVTSAIEHLNEAIRIKPNYALAYYNRGVGLYSRGRWDEAALEFRKSIQLDPSRARSYIALGDALLQKGDYHNAISVFQQALLRRPRDAETLSNIGVAWMRLGDNRQAALHFKRALQSDPGLKMAAENLKHIQM